METILSPPLPFTFEEGMLDSSGRLCDNWEKWKKGFKIYFCACELEKKSASIQMNILLHVIGEQCREIIDQSTERINNLDGVFKKLDDHFKIKKNVTVERHKFFTRSQKENESIEQYVLDLKKLAQTCEFGILNEDLIKDRLVCGLHSSTIRERLLREDDLTLNKAMDICRAVIVSRVYSDNIKQEKDMICDISDQSKAAVKMMKLDRPGYRSGEHVRRCRR
ncbi:uncharacterized protein LOC131854044 [Achroia grisella]|uniref:uncharacterized protein LOC131854044 n=1 Tax=Achroia grisella TaxID=688607 RepID=UPI0027D27F17|nr:uncharacterized protein LOC131854044 [Achroia grisella]